MWPNLRPSWLLTQNAHINEPCLQCENAKLLGPVPEHVGYSWAWHNPTCTLMFLQLGVGFLQREAGRSRSRFGRFVQQLSGSCKHQCEGPHAANKGNKPAFEPVGSSSVTLSSILFWCDFGGDGGSIRRRSVDRIPQLSYQCLSFTGAHTVGRQSRHHQESGFRHQRSS